MKIAIAIAALALALLGSAFLNLYYVNDGAGATLFSKGEEAYLFLGTGSRGYHLTYLQYPVVLIKEYFYAPMMPSDTHVSTMVIRVTPSTFERFHLDFGDEVASAPLFLTPIDDGLYALCVGEVLCKWVGNSFEPATEEERRKLDGTSRLIRGDMNNQLVNGWSVRQVRSSPGDHFEVAIAGKFTISAKNHATDARAYPNISVELLRPGRPPESLYNVDGSPRRVSRKEYARIFGRT